jgi:hypothetical protein
MVDFPFGQQGRKLLEDGLDEVRWECGHGTNSFVGKLRELPG